MRLHPCLIVLLLFTLSALPVSASADDNNPGVRLTGEDLRYGIDFLVFRNLAEGSLRFARDSTPGHYRADLEAKTLGVAAWLTGDRTQRYSAIMEQTADGSLRSVTYESTVIKRKHGEWTHRGKRYRFDYRAGKVLYDESDGGPFRQKHEYPLPAGQTPVDILTGFYNLRLGIYGALLSGAKLQIPTFTSRGISTIEVEVLPASALAAHSFFPQSGTLLRVTVDPEVFQTGGAALYAFLDGSGRPARGIVEDVIGMGDVYGYLQEPAAENTMAGVR